jgi:ligand-binding sensor domain-containing protein
MIVLLAVFFLFVCSAAAQTPPYYHYTTKDGLASNTVLDLMQDSEGYMWFATNNGISRFDGKRFINYSLQEGLNSTTIVSLLEGNDGEIFIGNYERGINVIKNGKITSYTLPESKGVYIKELFFENGKLSAFSSNDNFIDYLYGSFNIVSDTVDIKNESGSFIAFNRVIKNRDGYFWGMTSNGVYRYEGNRFNKLNINGIGNSPVYDICEDNKGNFLIGGIGAIYVVKNNNLIKTFRTEKPDDVIYKLLFDSKGNLWFSVLNSGFRVIYSGSDNIFNISSKLKIPKAAVDKFIEDNEGNIWVNSFGKGAICLNNLHIRNYNEDDGLSNNNVQAFVKDGFGRIVIGTFNGINIYENEHFDVFKFGGNVTDYVYEMQYINNRIYTCVTSHSHGVNKIISNKNEFRYLTGLTFCITNDGEYMLGQWGNNYYMNKDIVNLYENSYTVFGDSYKNSRINKIFEDSAGNIWFATNLGVCKMKNGEKTYFPDYMVLNSPVKSIIQDKNMTVWFAGEKGIASYHLLNGTISEYKESGGFLLLALNTLAVDNKNRLWAGSMKGLYIIANDTVKILNESTGLPSNEVLTLFYDSQNNEMYIGTSFGFCRFNIDRFDNYHSNPLKVKINSVSAGDYTHYNFDELKFEPDNNNIHISFSAPNFSSPSATIYQYSLNESWENTASDYLEFNALKHGDYKLTIRAKTANTAWSEPVYLRFTVKPRFIETIWFQFILAVFITGVIYFVSIYKIRINRRKNLEKLQITNQINELKHRAVSALMNPHFIYNALSSVQYLVNLDKKKEANNYIALMAKLVRQNLDLATENFVRLDEEINRLKLYLMIEKLRFGEKFNYGFIKGEHLNPETIEIPNMIIQPFVENAVIHGILPMNGSGFIKISFDSEVLEINRTSVKCLVIRVTDDGAGLLNSSNKKIEGHTSKAINIIKERLTLLSKELNLQNPIIITDLGEKSPKIQGTEVILTLPPTLYRYVEPSPVNN